MKPVVYDVVTFKRKPLPKSEFYSRMFVKAFGKKQKPDRPLLRKKEDLLFDEMEF